MYKTEPWWNHGETMAKPWRNMAEHGGTMAEPRRNHGGTMAEPWRNHGGTMTGPTEPRSETWFCVGQATIVWARDAHRCARTQAEPSGTKAEPNRRMRVLRWPGHDFVDASYSHTADGTKRNQGGTKVKNKVCVGQAKTSVTRALATPSFN